MTRGWSDGCRSSEGSRQWKFGAGFHLRFKDIAHLKTDTLTVELDDDARVPYQLDGEPVGYAPIELRVRDKALAVVMP